MPESQIESRVARIEGELEQLASAVTSLAASTSTFQRDLSTKIDNLSNAAHPNMSLMIQWAGVLLTIIALTATPIAWHYNTVIKDVETASQKDDKALRDEITYMRDNGSPSTAARLARNENRMDTLESIQRDAIRADLEELRKYRSKQLNGNTP